MTDPTLRGKRTVVRVVVWQVATGVLVALGFGVFSGGWAGASALAGGLIVAVGTAVFGWRLFAPGVASAQVVKRALMAGEALKWLWLVLAVWLALTKLRLAPLPLLAGLMAAQFGYWFGLVGRREG
ncbi:MAG: ATP synthase subunit I [Steroidobacteraceae bacterium]